MEIYAPIIFFFSKAIFPLYSQYFWEGMQLEQYDTLYFYPKFPLNYIAFLIPQKFSLKTLISRAVLGL